MMPLSEEHQVCIIESFNSTFRYLDDLLKGVKKVRAAIKLYFF